MPQEEKETRVHPFLLKESENQQLNKLNCKVLKLININPLGIRTRSPKSFKWQIIVL